MDSQKKSCIHMLMTYIFYQDNINNVKMGQKKQILMLMMC
jgi:hypothetical protein